MFQTIAPTDDHLAFAADSLVIQHFEECQGCGWCDYALGYFARCEDCGRFARREQMQARAGLYYCADHSPG